MREGRVDGEEEGRRGRELEGIGDSRWGKDRYESNQRNIFIEGAIMGQESNLALEKFPRIHKVDPR